MLLGCCLGTAWVLLGSCLGAVGGAAWMFPGRIDFLAKHTTPLRDVLILAHTRPRCVPARGASDLHVGFGAARRLAGPSPASATFTYLAGPRAGRYAWT
eukprot:387048-Lingulodinium_polyedra.AAC.1